MSAIVTGLFDTYEAASEAVRELEAAGIAHLDIGIVSNSPDLDVQAATPSGTETGATAGAVLGGGAGLLAGLGLLAIPGLGPVVAAGWLASAVGAVAGGAAGGLVGSLADLGLSESDATLYTDGVRRGGTLVSARVSDDQIAIARSIIARNNPLDADPRETDPEAEGERDRLSDTIGRA